MSNQDAGEPTPNAEIQVRVWTVTIDDNPDSTHVFDDLEVALAYIRADVQTNGSRKMALESETRPYGQYVSKVEQEDLENEKKQWGDGDVWLGAEA